MSSLENIVVAYILTKNKTCLLTSLVSLAEDEDKKREEIEKRRWFRLNLDDRSYYFCRHHFRFTQAEIYRLQLALRIPDEIRTKDRSRYSGVETLCILLRRLAYPNRLGDLETLFGRSRSQLSTIVNWMLKHIEDNFGYLITSMHLFWLEDDYLQQFADLITSKGSPLTNCVGFIDGTFRPTCRPSRNQKAAYSGHKREHGIKFQCVNTPNGLISNLFGPIEGSRYDSYMLSESRLLPNLELRFNRGPGQPSYCLYGDPAYPNRPEIISPFKGAVEPHQQQFSESMSKIRQTVEWEFGKVITYFAFCDFKKNLKMYLQAVSRYYVVAAILSNCHTCLNGSQTCNYFDMNPSTLEQCLGNIE